MAVKFSNPNSASVPIITYQENNLEKMALASPELESGKGEEKEGDISEEEKVPERWYNAILPLVVLVLVSLLRMYFDGKEPLLVTSRIRVGLKIL